AVRHKCKRHGGVRQGGGGAAAVRPVGARRGPSALRGGTQYSAAHRDHLRSAAQARLPAKRGREGDRREFRPRVRGYLERLTGSPPRPRERPGRGQEVQGLLPSTSALGGRGGGPDRRA